MGEIQLAYIERYKDIAIREMERAGIPASIKLAQGILESDSGQSTLARRVNNHFGIKCGANWKGETFYKEDDDYNDQGQIVKSCFRGYKNGDASYVAHSEFLRDPAKAFRYGFLFRLDPKDYQRWAYGLRQAGYATSATYSEQLITLIERYQLYRFDNMTLIDVDTPTEIVAVGILSNNDVRYTVVNKGERLEDLARRVDVSVRNLISYNENIQLDQNNLTEGERVYLQPKRNSYRGQQKFHSVEAGESMFAISQKYAVKLSKLFKRNRLENGQEPRANEKIKLRGCRVKEPPALRSARDETRPTNTTAPVLPNGELDMEEPATDVRPPTSRPTSPTPPPPVTVKPEMPGNTGTQPDAPVIIISPGSQPAKPAPTTPAPAPKPAPTTGNNPPPVVQPAPAPPATGSPVYHTVISGETLYAISRRYNTTVEKIKQLNGLTTDTISVGARLRVQ